MQRELYVDISAEGNGGSLYRIKEDSGRESFLYQHSTYDDSRDEIKIFETSYATFAQFWQMLTKDPEWFYQHPLFIHAEQRAFVSEQLKKVNWHVHPDEKWQLSHQRQWKKVLTDRNDYYQPLL